MKFFGCAVVARSGGQQCTQLEDYRVLSQGNEPGSKVYVRKGEAFQPFSYTTIPTGGLRWPQQPYVGQGCSCRAPLSCSSELCTCTSLAVPWRQECGPACACDPAICRARTAQQALQTDVLLQRTQKGLCAFAMHPVQEGAFVCPYAGELLTAKQAAARLQQYDAECVGHALLVVRETLPSGTSSLRLSIDATRCGNVARFFSHSCDGGNLDMQIVRASGLLLPYIALFAKRPIAAGEELTFSYGECNDGSAAGRHEKCFCATSDCLGYLPMLPS